MNIPNVIRHLRHLITATISVCAFYDLLLSEFLPSTWTAGAPRIWQILSALILSVPRGFWEGALFVAVLTACIELSHHHFTKPKAAKAPEFIPVPIAMQMLFESSEDTLMGKVARRFAKESNDVLHWYAVHCRAYGLNFYGAQPPSTILRQIPPEQLINLTFIDGGQKLISPLENKIYFQDVSVKSADVLAFKEVVADPEILRQAAPEPVWQSH